MRITSRLRVNSLFLDTRRRIRRGLPLLWRDPAELMRRCRVAVFGHYRLDLPVHSSTTSSAVPRAASGLPLSAVFFSHALELDGACISQFELCVALRERGTVKPRLIAFRDGPLRHEYEAAGIRVTTLSDVLERIPTRTRLDRVVEELGALIREFRTDIVHANTLLTFPAILAARSANVPSIWNPREHEAWQTYFGFLSRSAGECALRAFALPHKIIFVSNATLENWAPLNSQGNFSVIHNSLNKKRLGVVESLAHREETRRSMGIRDDEFVFLSVGTLCERKRQADLVQAFGLLTSEQALNIRIVLVGHQATGYARHMTRAMKGLSTAYRKRIHIQQPVQDIGRYYASADALVICSSSESNPRTLLEALAFQLPVIATRIPAIIEQVADQPGILLIRPGDVTGLAHQLAHLTSSRKDLMVASSAYHETNAEFETMIDAYSNAFAEATSTSGSK